MPAAESSTTARSSKRVQAHLKQHGVEVVTDGKAHVHVSGHKAEAGLRRLYDWVRPPAVIPVHGTPRHLAANAAIATDCHVPTACVIENGDVCRLTKTGREVLGQVGVGRLSWRRTGSCRGCRPMRCLTMRRTAH
ncbi:hypothetical protein EWI61_03960 [Methylolobus aquaticus]|nr:hypothetical protein EWI61_03960 [Methylolobus aquaticus]